MAQVPPARNDRINSATKLAISVLFMPLLSARGSSMGWPWLFFVPLVLLSYRQYRASSSRSIPLRRARLASSRISGSTRVKKPGTRISDQSSSRAMW